jgi:hypothetical protein
MDTHAYFFYIPNLRDFAGMIFTRTSATKDIQIVASTEVVKVIGRLTWCKIELV